MNEGKKLKIIVGCEESQAVTKELRALGHEAYSCDTQDCSGGASRMAFARGHICGLSKKKMALWYFLSAMHRFSSKRSKAF